MPQTGIIDVADFTGGLNLRDADHKIRDNECQTLLNLLLDADGSIKKRRGNKIYNTTPISANPLHSLYKFYKSDGTSVLLAGLAASLYGGTGSAFTLIGAIGTNNIRLSFVTWKDEVYIANGDQFKKYDGTSLTTVLGSPPLGKYIVFRKNRLYVAGVSSAPNRLYFCEVGDPANWNSGSNFLDIRSNDGDEITGIVPLLDNLVIYKKNSIWMLSGDKNLNFFLTPVISNIGCMAPKSLVSYGNVHYFLHRTGVYIFNGAQVVKISGKVDPEIDGIPYNYLDLACGVVYKEKYWLSYTPTTKTVNEKILVFDTRSGFGGWTLFEGMRFASFALLAGAGDKGELYAGISNNGVVWKADNGNNDGGNDIATAYKSKNFNMGNPILFKKVLYAHLTGENQDILLNVSILGDHGASSSLLNFTLSEDGSAVFDTAIFDTDKFASTNIGTTQKPTNAVRGRGIIVSLEESSQTPYIVSGIGFEYTVEKSEYKVWK